MEDKQHIKIKQERFKTHPRDKANFLSHALFCWQLPIFLNGLKKDLTDDDLYIPLKGYESKQLGDKLEKVWQEEKHCRKKPFLVWALIRQFGLEFAIVGIVFGPVEILAMVLQPWLLRKLLDYYTPNQNEITRQEAYIYAGMISLLSLIRLLAFHWFFFAMNALSMKLRIACSSLIYRHSLKLSKSAFDTVRVGQIINLLSNDVYRLEKVLCDLHFLWIGPVALIVAIYYMEVILGDTALTGIPIIVMCVLLQMYVSKAISVCRMNVASRTDHRINLVNDIINSIPTIKMYTWEKAFAKMVETARGLEIQQITKANRLRLVNNTFYVYITRLCTFLAIVGAVLTGKSITSQYVFALISIYDSLKITLTVIMPNGATMLGETKISVQRIQEFLLHDYQKQVEKSNCQGTISGIYLKDISVKWNPSWTNYVLSNVNFRVSSGETVGVIGAAGIGKSTLLQVILNEVQVSGGILEVGGTVSYAPQEPWIFSSSIKQNIIFGQELDLQKYIKVIQVCALEHDISMFLHGDETLVGERGVMLSGGQKARISLARAVYRDADTYLLDDPLSAVDAHVARHIVEECILGYLKDKCVVLVTHQIQYLQNVDRIYLLEHGQIVASGKYEQVVGLRDIFTQNLEKGSTVEAQVKQSDLQLETKEHRSTGVSVRECYKKYCLAAGHWSFTCLILLLFGLSQIVGNCVDYFATFWVNLQQGALDLSPKFEDFFTTSNCLYIYTAITVLLILISNICSLMFVKYCKEASTTLHNKMLTKIVHGTMTFFNHHSSGRILNRFSKDIGSIDEALPNNLMTVLLYSLGIIGSIVLIIVVNYWMIFPTIVFLVITYFYSTVFQPTNRNIKRTEGITRSFVLTHISASIQGLTTIRAFKAEDTLTQEFDNHQDLHTSAFYTFVASFAAFGFWTDLTTVVYSALVTFSFFLLESETNIGDVGLAITQSGLFMGAISSIVTIWAELDAQMTSVERVIEYAELPPELDDGTDTPPESWPLTGNILFESVSLKHSPDSPPVLKDTSFKIQPREKIGIVGRTGAGKTSLTSVIFRLFRFEGTIIIDNVDIKSIPLNTLRSKISIIPQEPVLFLTTLRKNLDPFDEFSDSELWKVLEELELRKMVSNLPLGFESMVSEGGSNFSMGQRQLLCLVRAVLKNNKIIVLDEATANVDLKTDELIQSTIRNKFKDCTVLTIAHRLNTVIDSDKILVMDDGMVVEFDHPKQLLQNSEGYFYRYVQKNSSSALTRITEM